MQFLCGFQTFVFWQLQINGRQLTDFFQISLHLLSGPGLALLDLIQCQPGRTNIYPYQPGCQLQCLVKQLLRLLWLTPEVLGNSICI